MKFVCSLIVVEDIGRSRFLYEELLGQQVKDDYSENVSFEGGFAIHQKSHFENLLDDHVVTKSNSFELYFEADNIEEIFEKVKKHGLEFVHEIVEQSWKQRVMRFYDYDKNIIEVGESLEHVAYRLHQQGEGLEEICHITYLDKQTVLMAIDRYTD